MNLKVHDILKKILYDPGNLYFILAEEKYINFDILYNSIIRVKDYNDSQSMIMRGVISLMADALNDCDAETIKEVGITWVESIGLMNMLTPQRQGAIRQMAERIYRACDQWLQKES